ncbi:5-formyltetrahydrofolate cyclo-ligase [Lysobacter fragariae]
MSADVTTPRNQLRRHLREQRRALPATQRIAAADALATQLLALPFAPTSGYVAGYWAMDGEIALHAWQLRLPRDCVYCLPVLGDDQRLRFAPWRPGDALVSNRYGIPEPDLAASSLLEGDALSLVVLPLVGFDANGSRLGMGGGWYDRTFAFRHENAAPPYLVGAAFSLQQVDTFQNEHWDVRLDAACTESATHDFTTATART